MSQDILEPRRDTGAACEPGAGEPVVPMWLMVLAPVLLVAGAIYFDRNGGWFNAGVYAPYRSAAELERYQPSGDEATGVFEAGRAVYARTCGACHQASGLGTPGQFPPLAGSEWVNEPGSGRVVRLVLGGLEGPITVKGQAYNNVMVPWAILSDEDLAAVITFVRQNKDWGNNAPAVTPEQVKAARAKLAGRSTPFTAEELMKIGPEE